MRIQRNDCLALIIDIQEKLFPHISENQIMLRNQIKLIKGSQVLGLPAIVTEQYRRGIGPTVAPIIELFGDNFTFKEKTEFSCFENSEIKESILHANKKNLVIIGIEAHVCVMQTVLDAIDLGQKPIVLADCIGSRDPYNKAVAIERMRSSGATIATAESLLFELLVKSGTEEFKQISSIVK